MLDIDVNLALLCATSQRRSIASRGVPHRDRLPATLMP
jgi:hypothetical protein